MWAMYSRNRGTWVDAEQDFDALPGSIGDPCRGGRARIRVSAPHAADSRRRNRVTAFAAEDPDAASTIQLVAAWSEQRWHWLSFLA
jgi:hypothetical protein